MKTRYKVLMVLMFLTIVVLTIMVFSPGHKKVVATVDTAPDGAAMPTNVAVKVESHTSVALLSAQDGSAPQVVTHQVNAYYVHRGDTIVMVDGLDSDVALVVGTNGNPQASRLMMTAHGPTIINVEFAGELKFFHENHLRSTSGGANRAFFPRNLVQNGVVVDPKADPNTLENMNPPQ